ncbi:Rha family transcriptional regulator [Endozoicomonas sp. ALC066]|uniref:Rha family transcriptional regulator n=1 Tax=Endozoicomonas sp. ALC066 TaxID=3403078 RepID=UPI003BB7A006
MEALKILNSHIKTMSSREIAQLTGKQHHHVKRDIEVVCGQIGVGVSSLGHTYYDSQNRSQTEYRLNYDLTLTLITGYNANLRYRVIQRWKELEFGEQKQNLPEPPFQGDLYSQVQGMWESTGQALGMISKEVDGVKQGVAAVEQKVEEVLSRNAPPAGYDNMTGLEKFFGISSQKLKILARQDNVHRTRYVVRAPDGATATVTAYNVQQMEISVDNLLWNSTRPTEQFMQHPLVGRYSRIKLQAATRAATNASRKALTM